MDNKEYAETIRELRYLLALNGTTPRTENKSLLNLNLDKRAKALQFSIDLATRYQNCKEMPKERKGIEIKGATVKCEFPEDCNFPDCICGTYTKPVLTKHRYKTLEDKGWNACLAECKMAVVKMRPTVDDLKKILCEFKFEGDFRKGDCKDCAYREAECNNAVTALLKGWDRRMR